MMGWMTDRQGTDEAHEAMDPRLRGDDFVAGGTCESAAVVV